MLRKKLLMLLLVLVATTVSCISTNAKGKQKWVKEKKTFYAKQNIVIYKEPKCSNGNLYDTYIKGDTIKIVSSSTKWYKVKKNNYTGYILKSSKGLSKKKVSKGYRGSKLNRRNGVVNGPVGRESYYNLRMSGVIRMMRNKGFSSKKYPYWVRKDGAKMLGPYVMVAACYRIHKKGSIVDTTLGQAIVCDTGGFIYSNPRGLDIAVSW